MDAQRRRIPSRMANYHEPAIQRSTTDVMADYRHPTHRPPIPGRMSNYPQLEDNNSALDESILPSPSPPQVVDTSDATLSEPHISPRISLDISIEVIEEDTRLGTLQ